MLGGPFALPDIDTPFHESNNTSGFLDLEFNNRIGFDFDPHFVLQGPGYKDPTPAGHILNDSKGGDAQALAPEQAAQASFSGDVVSSTEAPFESNETTAIPQQNKPRNEHYITQLSRACSPNLSTGDWADYLDFPPSTPSSVEAPAGTFGSFHHSPGQSSILHGWKTPSPELSISRDSVRATSEPGISFEGMSLEAVAQPLILLKDTFFMSLSKISDNRSSGISEDVIKWVASEFRNLLVASHEASASAIRKRSPRSKTKEASWTPLSDNRSSRVINTREAASYSGEITQELRSRPTAGKVFYIQTESMGSLSIKVVTGASHGSSKITTAAFTLTPAYGICQHGVSVTLVQTSYTGRSPSIARNIISFNVVPWRSPIHTAVLQNDVGKVQELLSSKQASPHDRLPDGTTLLWVSKKLLQNY